MQALVHVLDNCIRLPVAMGDHFSLGLNAGVHSDRKKQTPELPEPDEEARVLLFAKVTQLQLRRAWLEEVHFAQERIDRTPVYLGRNVRDYDAPRIRHLPQGTGAVYCTKMQHSRSASMERRYTVALQDGKVLPGPERIAAEVRFINALERTLGDAEEVVAAYKAWIAASESQANEVDRTTAALAVRWPHAHQVAVQAGLRGVHGVEEAFAVRLERSP